MNLNRHPFWRARATQNVILDVWSRPNADLIVVERPKGPVAMGLGDDAQVAALIDEHLPDVTYFVTAETVWPLLSGTTRTQLRRGDRWDWLWTSTPPEAHPKQAQVKILTPQQERLVPDVMAVGYPDRWDGADDSGATFFGYFDQTGVLAGAFAVHSPPEGSTDGAYLAGLAVLPSHRRQGIGAALTVACTRWALERFPMAHLGVFVGNQAALGLYTALGYQLGLPILNLFPVGPDAHEAPSANSSE
jgi:ribosomal protein S18 acetylase RimI-like enzyme